MATINFLFRSTKEEAPLTLRLLFRHNDVDYVFGSTIKLNVKKEYWTKLQIPVKLTTQFRFKVTT